MSSNTSIASKPLPPFPTEKHWLFGSGYLLRKNMLAQIKFLVGKYGDIFSLTLPFRNIVVLAHPDYVRYILLEGQKNYAKSISYDVLRLFLGNGLLTSEGDFWKQQRRLIAPAFHHKKLLAITSLMVESVEHAAEKLKQKADTGQYYDMLPEMNALTMDVISRAMFSTGVEEKAELVGKQIALLNQFTVDRLRQPIRLPSWFPTRSNQREAKAMKILDDVIYGIINQRRQEGVSKDDLLSMLLDARDEDTGEAMNSQQLRDEVTTIFVAGNETTANALTWLLYLLWQNPEAEKKMVQEIDEKLDSGLQLNFNTAMEFHYVRMVVEESLRMYPPAYSFSRKPVQDDEIAGYRILKDSYVFVPIINLHYDKRYWDEPEKFKPERFAPEKRNSIDRFVYLPFGGGPRICIGNNFALLEMQIAVILFYRNFRFKLKEGFAPEPEPLVTLKPKHGMLMRVERRR
jgi:cytochrome P450